MARKDVRVPRFSRWKTRATVLVCFLIVVTASVAIRHFWGARNASAGNSGLRSPARTSASKARPTTALPKAGTTSRQTPRQLKTVAVVNGQEISRDELARRSVSRFGKEVLQSLVNKHLILHACRQRGITVTEKDIDEETERIAKKFGLSTERWLTLLMTERDIDPQTYRRDIIWPTVALQRLAADRLTVTEKEMQRAWEAQYGPKVSVRMIARRDPHNAEKLRALAAANPSQFGNLAKDHSEDKTSSAARGIIPPIRLHVGDPKIEETVFALREGEVSRVVHAAGQYFIFKCEKHVPAIHVDPVAAGPAKARLRDQIRDRKLRAAANEVFKQLQDEAKGKIVNVYNEPALRKKYSGVAALIDGRQVTIRELGEECIARHGVEVLEADINRRLLLQQQRKRNVKVTEQDLDEEIARAADTFGYLKKDGTPDVKAWLDAVTKEQGISVETYVEDAVWPSAALKKLVRKSVTVTDEDLRKGFEANYGERVEVLAIVFGSQRRAVDVLADARDNPTDVFFGELAHQYSVEPVSKANYGKVPPIRRYGGQPLIEEEAFKLKPGELSGVIVVRDKFIVLRCLGRTKPVVSTIEAVRDELEKDIFEKKMRIAMAKEFDEIKKSARIENFLAGTSQSGKRRGSVRTTGHTAPGHKSRSAARPVQFNEPRAKSGVRR